MAVTWEEDSELVLSQSSIQRRSSVESWAMLKLHACQHTKVSSCEKSLHLVTLEQWTLCKNRIL